MSGGNLMLRNNNLIINNGDISLNGRLFIGGDASFNGNLHVSGTLGTNALSVGKQTADNGYALDISGNSNFTGDVSFGGGLTVNNINLAGLLQQNPAVGINNGIVVMNPTQINTFATINVTTTAQNTFTDINTFQSNTYFQSDVSMGGNVYLNGDVSMGGNLYIDGDVSLNKKIFIGGDSSLNGNVYIGKTLSIGKGNSTNGYIVDISSDNINGYGAMRVYESNKGTVPTASGGTITLQHGDASGVSSIVFLSKSNYGRDYASIAYYESVGTKYNYYNVESSALVLNVQRDSYNAMDPSSTDSIILQAAGSIIIDACGETMGETILQPNGGTVGIGQINANTEYAVDVSGIISSTYSTTTSDYRIKENIREIPDDYSIDDLNPCSYYNTLLQKEEVGFIAHEVQEKYPFLVSGEKDGSHYQSLNYIGMIGLLVKEIKALKRMVSE